MCYRNWADRRDTVYPRLTTAPQQTPPRINAALKDTLKAINVDNPPPNKRRRLIMHHPECWLHVLYLQFTLLRQCIAMFTQDEKRSQAENNRRCPQINAAPEKTLKTLNAAAFKRGNTSIIIWFLSKGDGVGFAKSVDKSSLVTTGHLVSQPGRSPSDICPLNNRVVYGLPWTRTKDASHRSWRTDELSNPGSELMWIFKRQGQTVNARDGQLQVATLRCLEDRRASRRDDSSDVF